MHSQGHGLEIDCRFLRFIQHVHPDVPIPVISGGTEGIDSHLKLKDAADALLYLGPRDSLALLGRRFDQKVWRNRQLDLRGFHRAILAARHDHISALSHARAHPSQT
jgi:hypothetical protein